MPNIITHTLFSQDLLSQLPDDKKDLFEGRHQLFEIGSNGPDFLFFHGLSPRHFIKNSKLRAFGSKAHASHVNDFYQSAIQSILNEEDEEIKKDMIVYLCGHLCHWALDSCAHPYIFYRTGDCHGKSAWWHHRFESCMDSIMLKVKRDCTIQEFRAYTVSQPSLGIARAIARVYVPFLNTVLNGNVKPHQILESLNDWCDIQKILYDPTGRKFNSILNMENLVNKESILSGFFVPKDAEDPFDTMNLLRKTWVHPCDDTITSNETFFEIYDRALVIANKAVQLFLDALENLESVQSLLDFIRDRNYNTGLNKELPMIYFDLVFEDE